MADITSIGSAAFKLLFNLLNWVVLCFGAAILIGFWWLWKKWKAKKDSFKKKNGAIEALIIKRDGTWYTDTLGMYKHGDNIDKMEFKRFGWTIPPLPANCVRAGQCMLYNYGPKQFAAIPCNLWDRIDLKKFNIELINMQMKNFVFLEQRAAINRWQFIKDAMAKWAPWIVLAFIVAATLTAIWFGAKFYTEMWQQVSAQRYAECSELLPSLKSGSATTPAG